MKGSLVTGMLSLPLPIGFFPSCPPMTCALAKKNGKHRESIKDQQSQSRDLWSPFFCWRRLTLRCTCGRFNIFTVR